MKPVWTSLQRNPFQKKPWTGKCCIKLLKMTVSISVTRIKKNRPTINAYSLGLSLIQSTARIFQSNPRWTAWCLLLNPPAWCQGRWCGNVRVRRRPVIMASDYEFEASVWIISNKSWTDRWSTATVSEAFGLVFNGRSCDTIIDSPTPKWLLTERQLHKGRSCCCLTSCWFGTAVWQTVPASGPCKLWHAPRWQVRLGSWASPKARQSEIFPPGRGHFTFNWNTFKLSYLGYWVDWDWEIGTCFDFFAVLAPNGPWTACQRWQRTTNSVRPLLFLANWLRSWNILPL